MIKQDEVKALYISISFTFDWHCKNSLSLNQKQNGLENGIETFSDCSDNSTYWHRPHGAPGLEDTGTEEDYQTDGNEDEEEGGGHQGETYHGAGNRITVTHKTCNIGCGRRETVRWKDGQRRDGETE